VNDVYQCLVCHEAVQHPKRHWYEIRVPGVDRFYLCDKHGQLVSWGDGWLTVDEHGENPRFVWKESLSVKDHPHLSRIEVREIPL